MDLKNKYLGLKMRKSAVDSTGPGINTPNSLPSTNVDETKDTEVFPKNPQLQSQLDSLDNAEDKMRRNAIFRARMNKGKK